ncbi:MAG: herpeto-tandem family RiPP, partial [Bacteroidales bacterium]|nr:herpeto-tandem family RiPP [Bacteroidales bacterium]
MPAPRIKIYTRSFDLKLYRLAKGLFEGLRDAEGNPIPCVRLTDQSADGYFYTMLRDRDCDVAVNIDEDAFLVDPQAALDLVGVLLEGGYANIGCSDGDPATTGRD